MEEKKAEKTVPLTSEVIKGVMEHLISAADEERRKDPAYQKLFQQHNGIEGLLRETEHRMTGAVLDAVQVLQEKYGVKMTNLVYYMLLGLPLFEDKLERDIKDLEGYSCCVDKSYYILSEVIKKELGIKEENGEGA